MRKRYGPKPVSVGASGKTIALSVTLRPAGNVWTGLTVHPCVRDDPLAAPRHRAFALAHLGAALGAGLCWIAYAVMSGPMGAFEWVAGLWLLSPAAVAFAPRLTGSLEVAYAVSIVNLTALISYLSFLTGGTESFLLVWLIVVPLEAALSGSRKTVVAAVLLCGLALAVLIGLEIAGLPQFVLPRDAAAALRSAVIFLALAYAGGAALALQRAETAMAEAARQGEARYRLLADHALDMISRHGPDGRLCFVSPACSSILGYRPEELEGRAPAALIHPQDRRRVQTAFARGIYYGENTTLEYRHRRKNGSYVWLETRCRPVPVEVPADTAHNRRAVRKSGPHAPAYDLIAVTRDISERKSDEEQLLEARDTAEAASRAKTHFLAGMSHELRTPLNAILGFSEVMKAQMFGTLGHARYLDYARHIHESGEHLRDLIDDVLDLSKIEAGKYRLIRESLQVAEIVESVLRTMCLTAKRAEVSLAVHLQPGLPRFSADRRAVKQMLLNLISNAVKFTPRGGKVAISARASGEAMILEVRDTGIGIPAAEAARLAQPFEQSVSVQRQRKRRRGDFAPAQAGSGLGLATVKSLARLHGGSMAISSTPGVGTQVRISLPLCAEMAPAGPAGRSKAANDDAA